MMNSWSSQYFLGKNTISMSVKQAWKENLRNKKSIKLMLLVYTVEIPYKLGKSKRSGRCSEITVEQQEQKKNRVS